MLHFISSKKNSNKSDAKQPAIIMLETNIQNLIGYKLYKQKLLKDYLIF